MFKNFFKIYVKWLAWYFNRSTNMDIILRFFKHLFVIFCYLDFISFNDDSFISGSTWYLVSFYLTSLFTLRFYFFIAESIGAAYARERRKWPACRETGGGSDGAEAERNVSKLFSICKYLKACFKFNICFVQHCSDGIHNN